MTGRKLTTKTSITEEVPEIVCETQPTNVQVIEEMLKVWQNCTAEDQFLPFYVSPRAKHILEDGFSKDAREFANIVIDIKKSFPDFKFYYESITEPTPNKVVIEGLRASGTHKGEPYSVAPGLLPAIPTTGKYIINDEERFIFAMKDHKVKTCHIIALGGFTGPPGLYEQIGGSMAPPAPTATATITEEEEEEEEEE